MALFEQMNQAMREKDAEKYLSALADDYQFVRHQTGETLDKSQATDMIRGMMASGAWDIEDQRCIYENDDILVVHSKMSFPDGSREAVMSVSLKKDGKIVRMETGATPLT